MKGLDAIFCRVASVLWSGVNAAARIWRPRLLGAPAKLPAGIVISVGNLQAGGAGKTPLVARLARECLAEGRTVVILCRGYGGVLESSGGVIAPADGPVDPAEFGDEAALLHGLVPGAWIGVGADRVAGCDRVVKRAGARPDVVILDDGFQNFRVARDIDILVVTSHTPWTQVHRDFLWNASRADLVVWTKGEALPPVASHVRSEMLRAKIALDPPDPVRQDRGHWLVTGVGDSEEAFRAFQKAGFRIERRTTFRDHARYSVDWVEDFLKGAGESGLRVVTTGKDAVKWKSLGISPLRFDEREPILRFERDDEERLWRTHLLSWLGVSPALDNAR